MAKTEARAAITQLTAGGTSAVVGVAGSYDNHLFLKHSNGTGAVTTPASCDVQVKLAGGTLWFSIGVFLASGTAGSTADIPPIPVPDTVASLRVVYTAPVGPTGATLDGEVGTITAL